MKKLHIYILSAFVAVACSIVSCEKLEMPTQDSPKISEEGEETDSTTVDSTVDTTAIDAYSIADIIEQNYEGKEKVYVVGYIVGYLSSSTMRGCVFAAGNVESNILMADTPVEKDEKKCVPVQLATSPLLCKQTRDALNLADNPQMLGKKVRLQGNIDTYMGTKGIKEAKNHMLLEDDFDYEAYYASLNDTTTTDVPNDSIPDNNENPVDDEQEADSTTQTLNDTINYVETRGYDPRTAFRVSDFKTYIPVYLEKHSQGAVGFSSVYVQGYIVGYIPKGQHSLSKTIFSAGDTETNIVIADSPDETDPNSCIAIELPTSYPDTREGLNLAENPQNLHQSVFIYGNVAPYMGTLGLKNARYYQFVTKRRRTTE